MTNRAKLYSTFLLALIFGFLISCAEHRSYEEGMKLSDPKRHELFLKKLEKSDLDYQVSWNGFVYYHTKDKEAVHRLAFNLEAPKAEVPDETESWKISKSEAEKIILNKYPNILSNARFAKHTTAELESDVEGFARTNEKVWQIRVVCEKGGLHAVFLVHPGSGIVYVVWEPNEEQSTKCI